MLQDNATELDNDDYDPILTLQLVSVAPLANSGK